ncbi:MAG TPA: NUDIX hydrolase [Steroidobacteraceae bacterium]|nr:NUDIX hydrolase [Steroidobacteraceae bacterium]
MRRANLKPELTVAAVIERQGRFLVVEERVARRLVFNQPAGHVEQGEALIDAAIREVREETAWGFEPQAVVGIYLWSHPQSQRAYLRVAFCGTVSDHDPSQPLDTGILRTHWFTRAQLLGHEPRLRTPMVLRCVDDFLAGARLPLDLVQQVPLEDVRSRAISV